ncbi:HU family DNA-binding protein [Prevotella corporis]|uniref:HU family DNA-binding protein n=1 Tax=Prevotella corporis TaxID=28128 RepID=UPI0006856A75|nr:histidinol phosphate phosphatase [Prevotella corporis]
MVSNSCKANNADQPCIYYANKPLQFILTERKLNVGKAGEKTVQIAQPTGRHRVDFRNFCERVAKSTTFNPQEVAAVLNLATETARDIVANGDIVDFGDLGTLKPSFKSKAVEVGTPFRAQVHIEKPVVRLVASTKYFTLTDVAYEQVEKKETKKKEEGGIGKKKPESEANP